MQEFIELCNRFNRAANKDGMPNKQQLLEQLDLIKSELEETYAAVEARDLVGIVDGYADIAVTWAGFGQQLEALGFNTKKALMDTAHNNLTKFIDVSAVDIVYESINMYKNKGVHVKSDFNDSYGCYSLKNIKHKVMKPVGFVPNNLSDCLPEDTFYKLI